MKKILSVFVVSCLLAFAFAGCSKASPEQAWADALEKNAELTDLQMKVDLTMELSAQGITMPISILMDSSIKNAKSETPLSNTQATVSVLGMEISMKVYTKDGYLYIDPMGMKVKQKDDTQVASEMASGLMNGFSVKDLRELKTETKDGKQVLTAKLNTEALVEGALNGAEQILGQDSGYDLGDVVITATVSKQGYIEKLILEAPIVLDEQEQAESAMSITMEILKTGKDVSVELPQDLDSYTETANEPLGLLGM